MKNNYLVSWSIDIDDADSYEDAAAKAKRMFEDAFSGDSESIATILTVIEKGTPNKLAQVDTLDKSHPEYSGVEFKTIM